MTDQTQPTPQHEYFDFEDEVAFVSGAAGGIGRATALAFAQQGADVAVIDVDEDGNEETARQVEELGSDALALTCDLREPAAVQAAVEQTVEALGRLDYACNNAGIEQQSVKTAALDVSEWDRLIETNLRGVFTSMKYQIPPLRERGGAIVNVASGAGIRGFPESGYVASKHGVVGLTKSAALEYAETDLRINAVCPGIVDTSMMDRVTDDREGGREAVIEQEPIGRMGEPEEIANAVLWLCSDAASFVLGHALVVDGGQTV